MAGPEYPDVPDSPGVPDVKRGPDNPGTATQQQMDGDEIVVNAYAGGEWGIFEANSKTVALAADSVISVGYDAEYRIADYPLEEGGFEAYDKVALPFTTRVVLTKGGTQAERTAFCKTLNQMRADTELYSVYTPEQAYNNVNITRVSIDRSLEAGAGMIRAEIVLQEIRVGAQVAFTATRDPASADQVNNGSNQPKATTVTTDGVQ